MSGNVDVTPGGTAKATRDAMARVEGKIDAIGCRVVHGGKTFSEPVVVDDKVLEQIQALSDLAPLHNPLAVAVIREAQRVAPVVAAFDTAFHRTLPPHAAQYAVPSYLGVRRYGFHGISYAYVSRRLESLAGAGKRTIICHLGNGASVCAIRDGVSVDTSMGLTPMEGLVMGTRSGDIDPGAILYLMRSGKSEKDIDDILNHRSGLLALSGTSGDVRELEKRAAGGDARAEASLDAFAYRVTKYIGAYAAALGGVDVLAFTAGIGERSAAVRAKICSPLGFLGITLDDAANRAQSTDERRVGTGSVDVWVVPTNEELEIARSAAKLLPQRCISRPCLHPRQESHPPALAFRA